MLFIKPHRGIGSNRRFNYHQQEELHRKYISHIEGSTNLAQRDFNLRFTHTIKSQHFLLNHIEAQVAIDISNFIIKKSYIGNTFHTQRVTLIQHSEISISDSHAINSQHYFFKHIVAQVAIDISNFIIKKNCIGNIFHTQRVALIQLSENSISDLHAINSQHYFF